MKKNKLFLGLTGVLTFFTTVLVSLTVLAEDHKMLVNDALDLTNKAVTGYTGVDYDLTDEGCYEMIEDSMEYCIDQEEEGAVLLYNKNKALPLAASERKVSLFGHNSVNPIYRSGAGGPIANYEYQIDFHKAFVDGGFQLNETLYSRYQDYNRRADGTNIARSASDVGEADLACYDSATKASFASFKDVAIVVLARYGSEGSDLSTHSANGLPLLRLDTYEKDMIKLIKESGFNKIVVLLNGCMPVELDWVKDPETAVDAVLWIGNPGYYALPGVVNVLKGDANPSGRTMETYAADSMNSPAMQNFGDINMDTSDMTDASVKADSQKMITYQEGIYVGYKYYETRYEDCILGQGNASSSVGQGVFAKSSNWNYADEVCYPFGFGLSYSTFEYKLNAVTFDAAKDTFKANVSVKNTSNVDGKAVVELYAQSPYTDYDKENLVEKASVQLMNYCKVAVPAGQTKVVDVEMDRYFLASYDAKKAKQYIFEAGDYYFSVGQNGAHDAINNILALKGKTNLTDHNGDAIDLDYAKQNAVKWTKEGNIDLESYKYSRYNEDVQVTNLFDDCDLNYWADEEDKITYLTRNHWDTTYPHKVEMVHVNERMEKALKMNNYKKPADAKKPVDGVDYNVKLDEKLLFADMVGVPYDDPKWDKFISQLDLDELAISVSDYRGIQSIVKIQKPANSVAEGPEGMLATFKYGDKRHTTGFATLPLVAASWDHDMQYRHGIRYGNEAVFAGVAMVNGPGTNLVRTPYLGRTSEYFSEDGVLNYYTAGHVVGGMIEKGCIGNIKHCFLNNQETNRQKVSTFALEQSMRELYARGWEGAFTYGKGMGVMTAYNRIGLTYTASSIALNQKLFRDEWNFQGSIIDDAMSQSDYSNAGDMLEAGTNLFCLDGNRGSQIVQQIRDTDDSHLLELLQRANKRLMYALTFSFMGGQDAQAVTGGLEWWESTLIAIDVVFGLATLACAALYVVKGYVKKED